MSALNATAFPHGAYPLAIELARFPYADYKTFLAQEKDGIDVFKSRQQAAFDAERRRWRDARIDEAPMVDPVVAQDGGVPNGCVGAFSEVTGSVWKVLVAVGALVEAGDALVLVESMKMEIVISAATRGVARNILAKPGQSVRAGELVMALEET